MRISAPKPCLLHLLLKPCMMMMMMMMMAMAPYYPCVYAISSCTHTHDIIYSSLLAFKDGITSDPTRSLDVWLSSNHTTTEYPNYCNWPGIGCNTTICDLDGHGSTGYLQVVTSITLVSLGLQGTLTTSALVSLSPHLTFLNISNNSFHGHILDAGDGDMIPAASNIFCSSLTHLDLSHNLFTGSINASIPLNCSASFKTLQYLDLSFNSFSSPFPTFLTSFSSLTFLDLSAMAMTTGLPPSLDRLCSKLQVFNLHDAGLSGSIRASTFANCSSLRSLDLSNNLLSGSLPLDWTPPHHGPAALQILKLQNNAFTGSIPSSLGNSSSTLTYFDVSKNLLTGPIPSSFGNLAFLEELRIFKNRLNGTVPPSIVNCTRLIYLKAGYNDLSGHVPEEIGAFQTAIWLSFTNNPRLSGTIPDSIGRCSNVQRLALDSTSVGGSLPPSLFNLTTLLELYLDSAEFSGTLSEEVGQLSSLTNLDLGFNHFYGPIPVGLGRLKTLQGIQLPGNSFEGRIPAALSGCSSLSVMDLSYNQLSGTIPETFSQIVSLNRLSLQYSCLCGEIPDIFGELDGLEILNLSGNMFHGTIPASLAGLVTITRTLDLSFNNLSGPIPASLGRMQMLQELNLAYNMFVGQIPEALGDCLGLQDLNLSMNMLDGEFPTSFDQLLGLIYLDVSQNNLSGSLPSYLQNLTDLIYVNLSYNHFQGAIPDIEIYKNSSASSLLGNPGLCGYPLLNTVPCTNSNTSQTHFSKKLTMILAVSVCVPIATVALLLLLATLSYYGYIGSIGRPAADSSGRDIEMKQQFKVWTANDIRDMTNGFDPANVIGAGGTSTCYRGVIRDKFGVHDDSIVVVKRLAMKGPDKKEAKRSFANELMVVCEMRHRNLVKVLGYCPDVKHEALVMEYMGGGDLDQHLHCSEEDGVGSKSLLSWQERKNVILDIAEGLVYMHHESVQPVIHCDIKPKNILLGGPDMVAKIADFGIAKLLEHDDNGGMTNTSFRGSFGYVAPENTTGSRITTKADVYNYGVLLLELVTGMRPTSTHLQKVGMSNIHTWARTSLEKGKVFDIVDKSVREAAKMDIRVWEEAVKVIEMGIRCSSRIPKDRPTMKLVRESLILMFRSNLSHDSHAISTNFLDNVDCLINPR